MCARTISRHGASTSGDGAGRLIPQPWSHAHPSDPPRHPRSSPLRPPRQLPGPVPGRVRDGAAGAAVPDPDRPRLRARLPRLHQPPEHGPDRRQLRGEQSGRLGVARRTRRSRPGTRARSSATRRRATATCPVKSGKPVVPDPAFIDGTGDGAATGLGDSVRVQLSCRFAVITPVISNLFGGSVRVSAESDFPVKSGLSSIVVTSAAAAAGVPSRPSRHLPPTS